MHWWPRVGSHCSRRKRGTVEDCGSLWVRNEGKHGWQGLAWTLEVSGRRAWDDWQRLRMSGPGIVCHRRRGWWEAGVQDEQRGGHGGMVHDAWKGENDRMAVTVTKKWVKLCDFPTNVDADVYFWMHIRRWSLRTADKKVYSSSNSEWQTGLNFWAEQSVKKSWGNKQSWALREWHIIK